MIFSKFYFCLERCLMFHSTYRYVCDRGMVRETNNNHKYMAWERMRKMVESDVP